MTGSIQEVTKTGAPITMAKGRQEYEPLGQSVRTSAPVVVNAPSGAPPPPSNDSLFPEWQCAVPKQLLPTHCALKLLADEKAYFGRWGDNAKKGNASQIIDLPTLNFTAPHSALNKV